MLHNVHFIDSTTDRKITIFCQIQPSFHESNTVIYRSQSPSSRAAARIIIFILKHIHIWTIDLLAGLIAAVQKVINKNNDFYLYVLKQV